MLLSSQLSRGEMSYSEVHSNQQLSLYQNFSTAYTTVKENQRLIFNIIRFFVILTSIALIGMGIDDRTLTGVSVWLKPLKFCVSTIIYLLTLAFLLNVYPYTRRKAKIIEHIVGWSLLFEILIIFGQGARGVYSHYNVSSPLDGVLFGLMGLFIGINVIIMALLAFDALRMKLKVSRPVQWAIFLGWVIVIIGSWVGGQMISQASHSVGVADGGKGLPLVNWSTIGGDLRIAHFLGIHAIQMVPLFAWFITKKWKASTSKHLLFVVIFALLYAGFVGAIFYQASQGIPLTHIMQ